MTKETTGFSEICEKVFDAADLDNMAGIAIGILAGDKIYADARGFRNYETGVEMNADTVFHCASISKTFTSMGIMKLVDEEKLSLDARLVDLLPYLSIADKRCDKIKLHHMLSHISGLQDLEDLGWEAAQKEPDALKKHALSEEVRKVMMNTNPEDAVFAYTDLTYDLLGLIISEVSGQTFEEFIAENFFKPAGMENTTFLTFERTGGSLARDDIDKAGMALPYSRNFFGKMELEYVYPYSRQHAPSSTLTSNVTDLLKWARFNMDKKSVSTAAYDKMWKERVYAEDKDAYMGMGWFIRKQGDCRLVGHEGGDVGFRTSFWTCPDRDVAMVILSNTSEAPIEVINEKFFTSIIETLL